MDVLKTIWKKIKPIFKNHYLLIILVFGVFIVFFDNHNLINRWRTSHNIRVLERDIVHYRNEIETNLEKMRLLQSCDLSLERFAREHYLMRRPNEDIFLINE